MAHRRFAAVDVGASSGRVVVGEVEPDRVGLREVHRFPNGPVERAGHLRWDASALLAEVRTGLRHAGEVESVGIDTWGVDYGLLDADGTLVEDPIAHRDDRTDAVIDAVDALVPQREQYERTGIQHLPFTTLYQLASEQGSPRWDRARHVVLLPDLLAHGLTGELRTERTNASTTGLLDVRTREWATPILDRLGIPAERLPALEDPGATRGTTADGVDVTTVGSHDTASAVVGVPATTDRFAYVACGTWSLVGVELAAPMVDDEAYAANFTNELGVDGRTRFLRNVGGLWLLQECLRTWGRDDVTALLDAAAAIPSGPRIDVDDEAFTAPGGMPDRIGRAAGVPDLGVVETVRCIVDSLADAFARTVATASKLSGRVVDVIHVVGGGARNELLCRRTAEASDLPVIAGPAEATALGNVLVQARAHGAAPQELEAMRALVARAGSFRRYDPA